MANPHIYQNTLKVIVRRYGRNDVLTVPINSNSTAKDIIEYCRDHKEGNCHLIEIWRGCPRKVEDFEKISDHLDQWGVYRNEVKFHLIYDKKTPTEPASQALENMRVLTEKNKVFLGGAEMTHTELLEMASRQQQQLEAQHQMLVAREQRLKYLKQQELHHQQMVAENERLRTLREKVEAQELKLKKIRAIRGQAVDQKSHNSNLGAELETMKALFNEKEKELALAVSKVEELTRQLHILRKSSQNVRENKQRADALMELDKLRSELLTRQKLNEQQNSKLSKQKEILIHRKSEMACMDDKIAELQARLYKKRQDKTDNLQNHINQVEPKTFLKYNQRPVSAIIAAVEPYIKHSSSDEPPQPSNGSSNNKSQTLPNNMKFPSESSEELNNNNENVNNKLLNTQYPKDFNNLHNKTISNSQLIPTNLGNENKESPRNNQNSTISTINSLNKVKISHASNNSSTSFSNLLPRPYGSTFSTSHISKKPDTGQITRPDNSKLTNSFSDSIVNDNLDVPITSTPKPKSVNSRNLDSLKASEQSSLAKYSNSDDRNLPTKEKSSSIPIVNHESQAPNNSQSSSSQPQQFAQWHFTNSPPVVTTSLTHTNSAFYQPETFINVNDTKSSNIYHKESNQHHKLQHVEKSTNFNNDIKLSDHNFKTYKMPDNITDTNDLLQKNITVIDKPLSELNKETDNSNFSISSSLIANDNVGRQGTSSIENYRKHTSSLYRDFIYEKNLSASKKVIEDIPKNFSENEITLDTSNYNERIKNDNTISNSFDHSNDNDGVLSDANTNELNSSMSTLSHDLDAERLHYKPIVTKLRRRSSSCDNEDISNMRNKFQTIAIASDDIVVTSEQIKEKNHLEVIQVNEIVDSYKETDGQDRDENVNAISRKDSRSPVPRILARKTNLKSNNSLKSNRRVSFDPLALLLDASLSGELDLVKETALLVKDASTANGEGITALHNAICGGYYEIVQFLVEFGCNVNSPDSDGWTPLHCAASCNNLPMVKILVEHGACIFATTISDHETAAEKCEEEEDGYDGCSEYLYSIQEKLGIINKGVVYAVYDYTAQNLDELTFQNRDSLVILRKGDENEKEWWWARSSDKEGYVARNLLGLFPRILLTSDKED